MYKKLTATIALSISIIMGGVTATPAMAVTDTKVKHDRVKIVDGSGDYMIYLQKKTTTAGLFYSTGATLYYTTYRGKAHRLPGFKAEGFTNLVVDNVVQVLGTAGQTSPASTDPKILNWRHLKTGSTGTAKLAATDTYRGATANGWLITRPTTKIDSTGQAVQQLLRYNSDGSSVAIGNPFPDGSDYGITTGDKGIVAYSTNYNHVEGDGKSAGLIRYQPYNAPGSWRTIYNAKAGSNIFCVKPSATHVGCEVNGAAGKHGGSGLFALDSSTATWLDSHLKTCQVISLTTVGGNIVGMSTTSQRVCVKGQVTRLGANGKVANSKRHYNTHSNVGVAFNRIIVASPDQRQLWSLNGVTKQPVVVAKTR